MVINYSTMGHLIQLLIMVVLVVNATRGSWRQPCTTYGCPYQPRYEPFVPAPPGHTPRCAKPGQTFCETLDHYPQQLIKFLVDKCSYNFASILKDESQSDFNAYRSKPEYNHGYDYPRPEVPQFHQQPVAFLPPEYPFSSQSPVVYSPPTNNTAQEGYTYSPPSGSQGNPFLLGETPKYSPESSTTLYKSNNFRLLSEDSNWWRPIRRNGASHNRYSHRENPLLQFANKSLAKRQASPEAIPLCRTNSEYIMPRAALNNRGNWMYVVNVVQPTENYSQLVRSEICGSTTCNGLCSLPEGYTSRCEQKYVQKRLVALEGSGDRLYTDVFWFPHGCACEIHPSF